MKPTSFSDNTKYIHNKGERPENETYHARDAINRHSCITNTSDSQSYYNVDTFRSPSFSTNLAPPHTHTRMYATISTEEDDEVATEPEQTEDEEEE